MEVTKHLKTLWFFLRHFKLKYNNLIDISAKTTVQILYDVGELSTKDGIVDLHLTRGRFCMANIREDCFDSYGCPSPKKLIKYISNRTGNCVFWEYKNQKKTVIMLPIDFLMKTLIKNLNF